MSYVKLLVTTKNPDPEDSEKNIGWEVCLDENDLRALAIKESGCSPQDVEDVYIKGLEIAE
jgi:hypothetical protein